MKKRKEQTALLEMAFLEIYQSRMVKKGVLGLSSGGTTLPKLRDKWDTPP